MRHGVAPAATRALQALRLQVQVLAVLLLEARRCEAQGCGYQGSDCRCGVYDMTGVSEAYAIRGPGTSYGDWIYTFNLCDGLIAPDDCMNVLPTVSFRLEDYFFQPQCESFASQAAGLTVTPTDQGVDIVMSLGLLQLTVHYVCAETTSVAPTAPIAAGNSVFMIWQTTNVCDPGSGVVPGAGGGGGLSFGSAFSIGLLCAGVVYVLGGCLYNRRKKAEGMAALPNVEFWTDVLPALVVDGSRYFRNRLAEAFPGPCGCMAVAGYQKLALDEEDPDGAPADGKKDKKHKKDKKDKKHKDKDKDKTSLKSKSKSKSRDKERDKERKSSKSKSKKAAPEAEAKLKKAPYRAPLVSALSSGARETGVKATVLNTKNHYYDESGTKRFRPDQ